MKMTVDRYCINIIPETKIDEAFLEEVLGLTAKGDTVLARRIAPIGLEYSWAYLEVSKVAQ